MGIVLMLWTTRQPLPTGAGCELGKECGWEADSREVFMPVGECVGGEGVGRGQGESDIKFFLCTGDLASFKYQSRTEDI